MTPARTATSLLLALAAGTAVGVPACAAGPPPRPPTEEEVRSFLSDVGQAFASADEAALRGFFEGGDAYPDRDLERLRAAEFWTLRPASRVTRLGPDAFRIRLLPGRQPPPRGPVSMRIHLELPVRRGGDGQLRILSREETARLADLPVPETHEAEEIVELEAPQEGDFGREAGHHYATGLRVAAGGDEVCLLVRFDPPLAGPGLRVDRPLSERQSFSFGEEIRVEMSFDADADGGTGFDMESFFRRKDGDGAQRVREWADFGAEAKLHVAGKKFVESDGTRTLGLRVKLSRVSLELRGPGTWADAGEALLERTLEDPEVGIDGDTLTVRVPAALLPLRAGDTYRVMLEENGRSSITLKARRGKASTGCPAAPET